MKRLWLVGLILLGTGLLLAGGRQEQSARPAVLAASADGFTLRYTNLVCRELACYDGAFLEDGTDAEVAGVTALVLENTGTVGVLEAQIVVIKGEQRLYFEAEYLPPESTVLVLERGCAPYSGPEIDDCYCLTVIPGEVSLGQQITVEDAGMDLTVTNQSNTELTRVRLHYKQFIAGEEMYLGGIAYSTELYCLQPGESRRISPYHYAAGHARVVAVEVSSWEG